MTDNVREIWWRYLIGRHIIEWKCCTCAESVKFIYLFKNEWVIGTVWSLLFSRIMTSWEHRMSLTQNKHGRRCLVLFALTYVMNNYWIMNNLLVRWKNIRNARCFCVIVSHLPPVLSRDHLKYFSTDSVFSHAERRANLNASFHFKYNARIDDDVRWSVNRVSFHNCNNWNTIEQSKLLCKHWYSV